MKSILHIGSVGVVELPAAQRKLGFKSDILFFYLHPLGIPIDLYYPTKYPIPIRYFEELYHLLRVSDTYEIFHFHFHLQYHSLVPFGLDVLLWKGLGKKVFIHHEGEDIRNKRELRIFAKYADKIFVSTPDLLEWSPTAIWIPNPVDLEKLPYVGVENKSESDKILIVHAPTNRTVKGTEHVLRAVERLKEEGYPVNLTIVENMKRPDALETYKKADIVIDWINLNYGIYGLVSIESMALGKPVLCSIKPEFIDTYYTGLPIVNSTPDTLAENLRMLVEDATLRQELGRKGRRYVEQKHDAMTVVQRIDELYEV